MGWNGPAGGEHFTFTMSGSAHVLSMYGSSGAQSRNHANHALPGKVGIQLFSKPRGAFGPKKRSTEPSAFVTSPGWRGLRSAICCSFSARVKKIAS